MTDTPKTLAERLAESVASRENELQDYDISIGIHEAAIAEIDADHADNPDMAEFRIKLDADLTETRKQRARAQLLLNAVQAQLAFTAE